VISWLIPVRDGQRWLGGAVRSALAECGADDEIIVVDDGSVDSPEQVLPRDARIALIRQPAQGIAAALERGRAACRGEWIARLDADDEALPGRISAQTRVLAADPRLAVVGGRAELVRDDGAVPEGMARYAAWVNSLEDLHRELLVESPLFHPAVLMRAEAIAQVGGYRSGDLPEDYDLWLRLVAAGWRLGAVDEVVVRLRDREDRLTRTDPRYRQAAFEQVKREFLAATSLASPKRVAVWGAGRTGRRWIKWLLGQGHTVPGIIDIGTAQSRSGILVSSPDSLAQLEMDLLIVAVGVRGAREQIRAEIEARRPALKEGQDWWAVV
jgi:glycosyltransferase involved in cell wall biosynthesis